MKKVKKAYYLLFYKLYKSFESIDNLTGMGYGLNDWKAGLVIQTLQICIIFFALNEINVFTYKNPFPETDPKLWIIPLCVIIAIINYFTFLHHDNWKKYVPEFSKYSRSFNLIINIIVVIICFGVFALLIFSYYQISKINWKEINHWK